MKHMLIAACCLLYADMAAGAETSGAQLLKRCGAYEDSVAGKPLTSEQALDAMWCIGYVSGLLDGFSISEFRIGAVTAACPPQETISRSDALAIIMQWLRKNPEEQALSGRRNAILALSRAFPCKRD